MQPNELTILKDTMSKGVPARESRTGTQLVSPAAGCEKKKKKKHLGNRASEHQIEYIRAYY